MRNPGYLLLPAFVMGSLMASAQDVREAYNFSNFSPQGTARSMGFGGALGSVGGDFSSLSVNPAGIGVYRSSELTITPSLRINATSSDYTTSTTADNNTHFNFNNFGAVFTHAPRGRRYDHKAWKSVSFGVGMNRIADFNQSYTYQGKNVTSSASQLFESDANQSTGSANTVNNSYGSMGYQSYLLAVNGAGQFISTVPFGGGVQQLKSEQITGGINELNMTLGGNFKEKLMLGISVGVPIVNYNSNMYYQETLSPDNNSANPYGFNNFNYTQALAIMGTGINGKIGAIYKISDVFRIGVAFLTPTYYALSDYSDPGISTLHNDSLVVLNVNNGQLAENRFDYNLTTPWKGVLSGTVILNKLGFITADYEYVDYSSMRYSYPVGFDYNNGVSYQEESDAINQQIKKTYKAASNFRLGGEAKIAKYFMVRLGFGYYGNAYTPYGESTANSSYTTQRIDASGGLGFHFRHFFADLGYVHSMYQGYEQPYSIQYNNGQGTNYVYSGPEATVPTAKINYSLNTVALTLGVKF